MVWFFERGGGVLELVTRYDNETAEYVLELRPAGATPTIERFRDQLIDEGVVTAAEFDRLVRPEKMIRPG